MSSKLPFPHEIKKDLGPQDKAVKDGVYGPMDGMIRAGPENMVLPVGYEMKAEDIYNFQPREDDVWIATFPRSGTTLSQELIWLIANDMDYEGARQHLTLRFPYLELQMFMPDTENPSERVLENLKNATSRRFIKTHLMFHLLHPDLLEKGSKVIYVARNPKDVMVSFYHFHKLIGKSSAFTGDFGTFFDYFMSDSVFYAPYWNHLIQGWKNRHKPNFLFLFYEEIKKDKEGSIRKLANFLGKSPTEEEIQKLKEHVEIKNFKKNSAVNTAAESMEPSIEGESFIRRGEVGNWKEYFTEEMNEKLERRAREKFDPVGLKFNF